MLTLSSSEVRRDWSRVLDAVIREKPVFIKRTRDYMMLCSTDMVSQLVCGVRIVADQFNEADGSVTLSAADLDIVSNGPDLPSAKAALASDIMEYAEEYYHEFELYSRAPNRKSHLPYVIKALTARSGKELEDAVICQNGKS